MTLKFWICVSGTKNPGETFDLTLRQEVGGFTLVGDEIEVPATGTYHVILTARLKTSDATDNIAMEVALALQGTPLEFGQVHRPGTATGNVGSVVISDIFSIGTPASNRLSVEHYTNTIPLEMVNVSRLVIRRLS